MAQSSAYSNMVNTQRLSAINPAEGRPGAEQGSVYGSKMNLQRMTSVNPNAFVVNASLYSRMGGEPAVSTTLRGFYGKALRDLRISRFFDLPTAEQMEQQIRDRIAFLTVALGGPNPTGMNLKEAYGQLSTMGLSDDHFNAAAEHVLAILRGQNIPQPLIDEVMEFLESARKKILG